MMAEAKLPPEGVLTLETEDAVLIEELVPEGGGEIGSIEIVMPS